MKFKYLSTILAFAAVLAGGAVMGGCSEDPELPPLSIPQSDWKANTTIADFKAQYWQTAENYCTEVGQTPDGDDIVLGGRVIANDITGNMYQCIVLQDATGQVTISTAKKNLYLRYKVGEECYINVTGLWAGKYAGLFQIGTQGDYNGTPQTSKMTEEEFDTHTSLNGWPNPSLVQPLVLTIDKINSMTNDVDSVMKYQSALVRINNVSWIGGGTEDWATLGEAGTNRYIIDEAGNRILVRNSGYSNFRDQLLPSGHGDVIAVMQWYRSDWQLVFRSNEDCLYFQGESYAPEVKGGGTAEDPYNVSSLLAGVSTTGDQWVTGYIVGWIDGMSIDEGARFNSAATVQSNILIADNPDVTQAGNCIAVALPTGTVRTNLNLQSNPANLGKQISLRGSIENYFGRLGVKAVNLYVWGDKGDDSATITPNPGGDTPVTGETATFQLATTITSGKQYVMVADGKCAILNTTNYGYLSVADVTVADGKITADLANAYTITVTDGGYYIQQSDSRYVYQTGTYNSFNFAAEATAESVWTITGDSTTGWTITNTGTSKWIQFDPNYKSYGCYPDARGTLPLLYEKI